MSSVFEFVAVGDLHFDKLARLFPDRHIELLIGEMHKPMQYALKKGIRNVIFLGDVAENPRLSYESLCAYIKFLHVYDGKLNIYTILGNHDFAENGVHSLQPLIALQELKMFKTVKFATTPKVIGKEVKINLSPYPFTEPVKNALNIGHFEVSGSIRDNGRVIKEAHDVGNYDWVMGHLHTPHDVGKYVHFVGTLAQKNFGESLPKSFTHVKVRMSGGKLQKQLVRIPNDPVFKLFNLKVESKSDLKEISKNPNYLYKLFVQSKYDISLKDLEKYPNIVDVKGFTTKDELTALMDEEFIEMREQNLILPSVTENLRAYLKSKGADKKQISRAMEITKDLLKRGGEKR